jgi:hypothetical protein
MEMFGMMSVLHVLEMRSLRGSSSVRTVHCVLHCAGARADNVC